MSPPAPINGSATPCQHIPRFSELYEFLSFPSSRSHGFVLLQNKLSLYITFISLIRWVHRLLSRIHCYRLCSRIPSPPTLRILARFWSRHFLDHQLSMSQSTRRDARLLPVLGCRLLYSQVAPREGTAPIRWQMPSWAKRLHAGVRHFPCGGPDSHVHSLISTAAPANNELTRTICQV